MLLIYTCSVSEVNDWPVLQVCKSVKLHTEGDVKTAAANTKTAACERGPSNKHLCVPLSVVNTLLP